MTPAGEMAKLSTGSPVSGKVKVGIEGPDSKRAWYLGVFVTAYGFFGWAGVGSTPVLYVGLIDITGASRQDASQPFTAMMCSYFLGSLVYGVLSRWFRERTLMVGASLVTSTTLLASYFIRNITLLTIVLGAIHGIGVAAVGVVPGLLLTKYFVKYRATAFGLMSVTVSLTGMVFPPVATYLLTTFGFSGTLLILAALSFHQLLCCVPLGKSALRLPPPTLPEAPISTVMSPTVQKSTLESSSTKVKGYVPDTWKHIDDDETPHLQTGADSLTTLVVNEKEKSSRLNKVKPFLRGIYLLICSTNACGCFAVFTYTLTIVDFATDNGFQRTNAAMLMTAMSIGWAVASLVTAPAVDSGLVTKEAVVVSSFVLQGLGFALMAPLKTSYPWMLASSAMVGWGQGSRGFLLFLFVSERFKRQQTPVAFALMSLSCTLPFLARAPIIGYVRDTLGSYDMLMLTLGAVEAAFAAAWTVVALVKWKKKRAHLRLAIPFGLNGTIH